MRELLRVDRLVFGVTVRTEGVWDERTELRRLTCVRVEDGRLTRGLACWRGAADRRETERLLRVGVDR